MNIDLDWSELYSARNIIKKRFPSIWSIPLIKKELALLAKHLHPDIHILEIGAGDRRTEKKLKELCPSASYKSFDIDASTFQDFYELDQIQGRYDLIFGFELIEHMSPPQGLHMVKSLQRHLTDTGVLILGTPNLYHPHRYFGDLTHVTPYKYEELGALLTLGGYEVQAIYRKFNDAFVQRFIRVHLLSFIHRWLDIDFAHTVMIVARPQKTTD